MKGLVSFHAADPAIFEGLLAPLTAGEKVNPETFLDAARRLRTAEHRCRRYRLALERTAYGLEPPAPAEDGTIWNRVRSRLERFDFKPDPIALLVAERIEPDLHLHGRPFLVTEGSADRVVTLVDDYARCEGAQAADALVLEQLVRIDVKLAGGLEPEDSEDLSADATYRNDLLGGLRQVYDLAQAARSGGEWGPLGSARHPAAEALVRELPWRAIQLHSLAVPCWIARDVDGLATVCAAAEIPVPAFLLPAWPLFPRLVEEFPGLREATTLELASSPGVGGYVTPADIPKLLAFLADEGTRIIQAAGRHGEGGPCATLLRKIRECARFADRRGAGYVEACGIVPPGRESPAGET